MNIKDIFIDFFVNHGHKQIPSAPLVPENDPSVLFNTAGMQPLVPYLMGQPHPYGTRLVDYQKCIRTIDLDSIGDSTHHTFFEMLGNWSLGDYFKDESIEWSFELLTKNLKIPIEKLAVTIYAGEGAIPEDTVSYNKWISLGMPAERIAKTIEDNFWIAGESGPCGPDTEIFYWRSLEPVQPRFDPEDNRWVEIWNNVFMEFYKDSEGNITELPKKNVDTGMGVERITSVLEGVNDNYLSSIWKDVIDEIVDIVGMPYENHEISMRIIADHIRTAVFILADPAGIKPSNTDQGYVLRRLIRRAIRHAKKLTIDINSDWDERIARIILSKYNKYYSELIDNEAVVLIELTKEKTKFIKTLEKGLKEFEKAKIGEVLDAERKSQGFAKYMDADTVFRLYDTFGFPFELTHEEASNRGIWADIEGAKEKFKEHQEKSRIGAEHKFKGGLAGDTEIETRYHTATHLLNAALKIVVNKDVHQKGSNITAERMRFDFSCDEKVTEEQQRQVEEIVNSWIGQGINIKVEEMSKEEASKSGAECMFIDRYPDIVTVYSIGDFSKELCGGPHVANTSEIGRFKIVKEEASSAGVRRIKAIIEEV